MEIIAGIIIALLFVYAADKYMQGSKERETELVEPIQTDTRQKLIISTDAHPMSDEDDCQTWISTWKHVEQIYNLRGIDSTNFFEGSGVPFIRQLLDETGAPQSIPIVRGASVTNDIATVTEGAQFYIDQLQHTDTKIEVWVWGAISTLAQALRARPDLATRISAVYEIGSGNVLIDKPAYDYRRNNHSNDFTLYLDNQAFRGMMRSGDKSKLVAPHKYIEVSKIGGVWMKYTVPLMQKQVEFANQGWKNGDIPCYLYSINPSLRDRIFKRDINKWFIADGQSAQEAMAANDVRDWMASRIKLNVDLY